MIDTSAVKQHFKDASDEEAKALYVWVTACMEVRGLIDIAGADAPKAKRSDAGKPRKTKTDKTSDHIPETGKMVDNPEQPSLSGLPAETGVGE